MTVQPSSGLFNYNPAGSDFVIEAYSRIGIRGGALNAQHMFDARSSMNLLLSQWSTRVPNLWLVTLLSIPLVQGVSTYNVPTNTVTVLDAYLRQFQVGNAVNVAVNVSTVINTPTVTINWPGNGLYTGEWIEIGVPISVGGLILGGFYQVSSTIDLNNFTITAGKNAVSTVNNGGVVPQYTAQLGSSIVYVTLPNVNLQVGQNFQVTTQTSVGGLILLGSYQVTSYVSGTTFGITATGLAGSNAVVFQNGGLESFSVQLGSVDPIDRVLTPISRTDYADQPDKFMQGFPSTYWYNRQINPVITLWQPPDGNGPYVLQLYVVTQPQDAVLENGTTMNIPYRFYDAFAAGLARRLARKYAPQLVQELLIEENMALEQTINEDTESAPLFIRPGLASYFR